ncbi:Uncharacterised protein [Mycoplasmopsis maculosa]|uniref:Uncharacterized protein n=1 Tax=Mycoplasmopsis maculosa TaxID=114885 RepID=A0A449B4S4_9BACT|nr:GA module-containing protein [Mycoplasmopsis maculosa]VEU75569.1 Uncharacterised protein [Mycoplasmopsis maculosa]
MDKNKKKKIIIGASTAGGLILLSGAIAIPFLAKSCINKDNTGDQNSTDPSKKDLSKKEELKNIINDSNITIPNEFKNYLNLLLENESELENTDLEILKNSVIDLSSINKQKENFNNKIISNEYKEFINNLLSININKTLEKVEEINNNVNINNKSSILFINENKDIISKTEQELFNFNKYEKEIYNDYSMLNSLFTENNSIFPIDVKENILNSETLNNFVESKNIKKVLSKYSLISEKAKELFSIKNSISAKDNKNEKEVELLNEISNIYENDRVKSSKVLESNILEKINSLIEKANSLSENDPSSNNIENIRTSANNEISNLNNLSEELKNSYKNKINSLNFEASINEIKTRANSFNDLVSSILEHINEANEIKTTNKYNNATNKQGFDDKLNEVKLLLLNNKLTNKDAYINSSSSIFEINNLLEELINLQNSLNGETPRDELQIFKEDVESKLSPNFTDRVRYYNLESSIYSANINDKNKEFFISEPEISGVELTFKKAEILSDNVNQLRLIYSAKSKNNSSLITDVEKVYTFNNDFSQKINELNYSNLDELFDFNYEELSKEFKNDLLNNDSLKEKHFKNKFSNLNGFFTYELDKNSFEYQNNKIVADIKIKVNEKDIKVIKLQTSQNIDFKDEFWRGVNITMGDWFKNSAYYDDPNYFYNNKESMDKAFAISRKQETNFNIWFTLEIFNNEKDKIAEMQEKTLDSKVNLVEPTQSSTQNSLTPDQIKSVIENIKQNRINDLFNIQVDNGITWELINFDNNNIFKTDRLSTNKAEFKFRITKNNETRELIIPLLTKGENKDDQDTKDLEYLINLIKTDENKSDATKILELIKVKNKKQTHNQANAKDAIETFNNYYELPKKGKFEIYADTLVEHTNFVNSTEGGKAKIFFWFKENGEPLSKVYNKYSSSHKLTQGTFIEYAKEIKFFKPLTYRDIKPANQNGWFVQSDFNVTSANNISANHKNIIDQINSTNFELRKATAAIANRKNFDFSVLDPKDIISQQAYDMLNYLLKLKTNQTSDNNDTSGFVNPNTSGGSRDDQPISTNIKSGDYYVSNDSIVKNGDATNTANLNEIERNYFIYYYDVQSTNNNELSFKIGFIDKNNIAKRYTNGRIITLRNLRNDYKENLYPEIIVNSIKYSDLTINNLNNLSTSQFIDFVKAGNKTELNKYVFLTNDVTYKNYTLAKENFEIAEAKKGENNSVYIKLKVTNPTSNKSYKANAWYKLSGFSSGTGNKEELTFEHSSLKTIFNSSTNITRTRELEPYYKDLLWTFNKQEEKAEWLLKEKYISKTLLKENTTNRKIKFNLYGNMLIQDIRRLTRINDSSRNYWTEFDFEKLINGETLVSRIQTHIYNRESDSSPYPRFYFTIKAKYIANEGIKFEVELEDKQYKLFVGNPYKEAITVDESRGPRFGEFKNEKAFLINNSGAKVIIEYTNNVEHEDFGQETNQFNYKKMDYSQENQPILFYTPESVINSQEYNPNQNVHFELHNGYLQDQEYIHNSWEGIEEVDNVRNRSFAFNQGTATQFGKVNKDSKDGRFYIITNNHVESIKNISEVQGDNLPKKATRNYITKVSNNFGNNVDNGFSYWGGLNTANKIPIEVIWSGVDQISEKGEKKSGLVVDVTVFAVDVNGLIQDAKKQGKFDLSSWFENWFTLPNMNMDYLGSEHGVHFGPNVKKFAMTGFPYGKQAGYYINRASSNSGNIALLRQNGYVQTFYNAGNSGTGILGKDNSYVSTINSGAPLTFLQSWNYETSTHNFLGANFNGENPLDINNSNSIGAQILRWNLKSPLSVDLPWYLKEINKK